MRQRSPRFIRNSFPSVALFLLAASCEAQSYTIRTVAGSLYSTAAAPSDVVGPATAAQLRGPLGLALDSAGNLYIADTCNHRIRKVSPQGILSTFAGTGTTNGVCESGGRYSGDGGQAANALLNCPRSVAVDRAGVVYIADTGNNVIRKVTPNGIISTFAGNGMPGYSGDGGQASKARFTPFALAIDPANNLYFSDGGDVSVIRKISPDGVIATFAGTGTKGYTRDGGLAIQSSLTNPDGIALDKAGNLFIAESGTNIVRKVDVNGVITTVAGNFTAPYAYGGDGGPATARLVPESRGRCGRR